MTFIKIVNQNNKNIAFIVGNGINRYSSNRSGNSWDAILITLWNRYSYSRKIEIPHGIALTEFYDVLDLELSRDNRRKKKVNLQKEFCDLLTTWEPEEHHGYFIRWAASHDCPVLTTNFEDILSKSINANLHHNKNESFTDFYPWASYFSHQEISNPADNFAIWHVNGMQRYYRSIRLGLSHYMGSAQRARNWIHGSDENFPFLGKNQNVWKGADTWLHIIFNKPLMIFGLGLDRTEVFLRWLLIERAKYFSKYPERFQSAWYVRKGNKPLNGKELFLKHVGIEIVSVAKYSQLYSSPWR